MSSHVVLLAKVCLGIERTHKVNFDTCTKFSPKIPSPKALSMSQKQNNFLLWKKTFGENCRFCNLIWSPNQSILQKNKSLAKFKFEENPLELDSKHFSLVFLPSYSKSLNVVKSFSKKFHRLIRKTTPGLILCFRAVNNW